MRKTIKFIDILIKSIATFVIIFVTSLCVISLVPRERKNIAVEEVYELEVYFDSEKVEKIVSPNSDIRFIVFKEKLDVNSLVALSKKYALENNFKRLYVTFLNQNKESLVVIVDENNNAYIENK